MLSLSIYSSMIPRARHSTAQRCHLCTKQQTKCVPIRVHTIVSKEGCTYMHAASGLFSWSMELLGFASRLFAPKMLDHLTTSAIPLFRSVIPCERFPGAWSSWHLQVACLHLNFWTICCICHSVPFLLVSERSGRYERAEPSATRSALYIIS